MKKELSKLVFADCLFMFFLALSSFFTNIFGSIFYGVAFVLPVCLLLIPSKKAEGEEDDYKINVIGSKRAIKLSAAFCFPTVLIIILFSFLTSLLIQLLGLGAEASAHEGNILYVVLVYALAPAIFEEMLFRYIPIRKLGAYSPKLAVIYSAILFSLVHANILQMPYALVGGLILAAIDVAADSVLPSMIIHFINNVLSLLWEREGESTLFVIIFFSSLLLLSAISVAYIIIKRKSVKAEFSKIFTDKSKFIFTYPFGVFLFVMIFMAIATCIR